MAKQKAIGWMKYFDGKIAFEKYSSFLPEDATHIGWREVYTDDALSAITAENEALKKSIGWKDASVDGYPPCACEVLIVRQGRTVHAAFIGDSFWYNGQKVATLNWMPMPAPPTEATGEEG